MASKGPPIAADPHSPRQPGSFQVFLRWLISIPAWSGDDPAKHFLETALSLCCRAPPACAGTMRWGGRRCRELPARASCQHPLSPLHQHWVLPTGLLERFLRGGEARRDRKLGNRLSPTQAPPPSEVVTGVLWGEQEHKPREGFWGWLRTEAPL